MFGVEVFNLTKPPGHPSATLTLGAILHTTGSQFSSVENFASLVTFKFGLIFFFSFSLKQHFMCFTSYKIISLSSSNWLPSACSYITIVSEVARCYREHTVCRTGLGREQPTGRRDTRGQEITGLLWRVKFSSSIMY